MIVNRIGEKEHMNEMKKNTIKMAEIENYLKFMYPIAITEIKERQKEFLSFANTFDAQNSFLMDVLNVHQMLSENLEQIQKESTKYLTLVAQNDRLTQLLWIEEAYRILLAKCYFKENIQKEDITEEIAQEVKDFWEKTFQLLWDKSLKEKEQEEERRYQKIMELQNEESKKLSDFAYLVSLDKELLEEFDPSKKVVDSTFQPVDHLRLHNDLMGYLNYFNQMEQKQTPSSFVCDNRRILTIYDQYQKAGILPQKESNEKVKTLKLVIQKLKM